MNEKAMRCVRALRICHSNEDCRDCEFVDSDHDEKSCVNVLFEDAADLIQTLSEQLESAQPKWISVEAGLPDENKPVLVFDEYNGVGISFHTRYTNSFVGLSKDVLFGSVTHWMPLPEAPKE